MFHVDVTMEDSRIVTAETDVPGEMDVTFFDNVTGKRFVKRMTLETLGKVLMVGLGGIDSADVPGFTYASVESEFAGCPQECRPIP